MANPEHLAKLNEGVEAWNQWRKDNREIDPDLREVALNGIDLAGANLDRVYLYGAKLRQANLSSTSLLVATLNNADLTAADLSNAEASAAGFMFTQLQGANLQHAGLLGARMNRADLREANLTDAKLFRAELSQANLHRAILNGASLVEANLRMTDMSCADLRNANLYGANLSLSNLAGSDLTDAQLGWANLVRTNFEGANLSGCGVYGVSAWDIQLKGAIQSSLVITPDYLPTIQVDNLEVAQFVYLLLNNDKIRHVIDTITSKVVLILGRFTAERKKILNAIRDELRKRDYVPILFDFQNPDCKDLTGTVTTLANMARFIIADLTDPSCIPYELGRVIPNTKVPVQAIILDGKQEFGMFNDLLDYRWVLPPHRYQSEETLLADLGDQVIAPAEAKVIELKQK
jgi:uncharacterized protein YjbI with pentapeptide repeats